MAETISQNNEVENPSGSTSQKDEKAETKRLYRRPKTSLFSLKHNIVEEENEAEDPEEIDPSLPQDKFNEEDFEKFLTEFKKNIRETNKPLFNVLETVKWRIDENLNLHLLFVSNTMQAEFDRTRENFVQTARQNLNNYGLRVISEVSKEVSTISHIKSRKDMYQDLVEKYPIVDKFTKRLGLDIENDPD